VRDRIARRSDHEPPVPFSSVIGHNHEVSAADEFPKPFIDARSFQQPLAGVASSTSRVIGPTRVEGSRMVLADRFLGSCPELFADSFFAGLGLRFFLTASKLEVCSIQSFLQIFSAIRLLSVVLGTPEAERKSCAK
jgi:hypothetical protein